MERYGNSLSGCGSTTKPSKVAIITSYRVSHFVAKYKKPFWRTLEINYTDRAGHLSNFSATQLQGIDWKVVNVEELAEKLTTLTFDKQWW